MIKEGREKDGVVESFAVSLPNFCKTINLKWNEMEQPSRSF